MTLGSDQIKFVGMNQSLTVAEAGKIGGKKRAKNQTKAERIKLARMGGLASGAARRRKGKSKKEEVV